MLDIPDNDFEDPVLDPSFSPRTLSLKLPFIEAAQKETFVNRQEDSILPEKLRYIDKEIKSILYTPEPSGDYSLDPDFRLG